MSGFSLEDLEALVASRVGAPAASSWTATLLSEGPSRIAKKFGEEAIELVIATVESERQPVIMEAADVLYHLMVLLKARKVGLDEVLAELERRTRMSGVAEKAARRKD